MKHQAGFTLLEVVLSMTALALLMMLIYSAFFLAMRAVERGSNAIVAQQRLRASREVLIRQLKSLSMHYVMGEGDERDSSMMCFRGTSTALTFITATAQEGGGGLAHVIYRVFDDPPRLEMIEDPEIESCTFEVGSRASEPVTLLDGFTKLRFQYQDSEGYGWKDEWDSFAEDPGGLPLGVQVLIDGIAGADLDVATQALPIPIMVCAYDDSICSEPDVACEFTPGCREAVEAAENQEDDAASGHDKDSDADEDDAPDPDDEPDEPDDE